LGDITEYDGKMDDMDATKFAGLYGVWSNGEVPWYPMPGKRNTTSELNVWLFNTNTIQSSDSDPTPLSLVQKHRWTVTDYSVVKTLRTACEPKRASNPGGTDYDHYGWNIETSGGGCVYLGGGIMDQVNAIHGGFTVQDEWRIEYLWPDVEDLPFPLYSGNSPAVVNADWQSRTNTADWGIWPCQQLMSFDPGGMGEWITHPLHKRDDIHVPTLP
jgi:hypothetical protein